MIKKVFIIAEDPIKASIAAEAYVFRLVVTITKSREIRASIARDLLLMIAGGWLINWTFKKLRWMTQDQDSGPRAHRNPLKVYEACDPEQIETDQKICPGQRHAQESSFDRGFLGFTRGCGPAWP